MVNPKKDDIELKSRSGDGFDSLHKDFLHYKDFCEGKTNYKYAESGIGMSFSELKPAVTLMARSYGSGKNDWLQTEFEIIQPHKPFSKRIISLFEAPYEALYAGKPIPFNQIPELMELIPDIDNALPFKDISPDNNGVFQYQDWNDMKDKQGKTWL